MVRAFTCACAPAALLALGTLAAGQAPPPDAPRTLHVRLVAEIGGDLVEEDYLLNRVSSIDIARDGTIYLADAGDRAVKVYDRRGVFVRRFGREGQGPGEFLMPGLVVVDSVVQVFDARQQRISTFALDGTHRTTRRLPEISDPIPAVVHPLRGGGLIGITPARFSPGRPEHQPNATVVYRAPGGSETRVLASFHSGAILWHPEDSAYPWSLFAGDFGAGGAVALHGDSLLALVDGYTGTVRWYSADPAGLTELRTARIPLTSPAVTEADLRSAEQKARSSGKTTLPRRLSLDGPPRWSVGSEAVFADDGSLWVRSNVDAEQGDVWSVFPSGNGPPRVIRMPGAFDLRALHGQRMYGIALTANDAQLLRVFEWGWQ